MEVEVLVDSHGTIVAMLAVGERQSTGRRAVDRAAVSPLPPIIQMRPRSGQLCHVVTLPTELESAPMKEIHTSCRFVEDAGGPRLERIAD
jgi:hypothetical protein